MECGCLIISILKFTWGIWRTLQRFAKAMALSEVAGPRIPTTGGLEEKPLSGENIKSDTTTGGFEE